jgi:hypothetical protein
MNLTNLKNISHKPYLEIYLVSINGDIYSKRYGRYLKGYFKNGYKAHILRKEGRGLNKSVHSIVMELFGPDKPSLKHEINHIDGIKNNNHISNLQWVTRSENISHAYKNGLIPDRKGHKNSNAKLAKNERVDIIRKRCKGFKVKDLAEMFDVHPCTISRIVKKGY